MRNAEVQWIRQEATDSQIQGILDQRDKLLKDANLAAELKANKDAPVQDFEDVCEELGV